MSQRSKRYRAKIIGKSNSSRRIVEVQGGNVTTFLAGILHKHIKVMLEDSITSHREEDDDRDNSKLSDKSINFDTEDSTFVN